MEKLGRIIEGYWDCSYCGTKKIGGSKRNCPNCGKARGIDTNFYLDENNIHYLNDEEAKQISKNPDWLCSYCEQLNSDDDCTCISCGASKTDSEKNYFEMKKKKEEKEIEKAEEKFYSELQIQDNEDTCLETDSNVYFNSYKNNSSKTKNFTKLITEFFSTYSISIIWALLAILIVSGIIWAIVPKKDTLNVVGVSWTRSITIEEERTVKENDWSVPSGGRVYSTQEEIHHYNQVVDHYETKTETKTRQVIDHYEDYVSGYKDLGNGHFQEIISQRPVYKTETYTETKQVPVYKSVPVYKTKYYYEIEKWFTVRSIDTNGTNKDPYWGEVILKEKEREGKRSEKYSIIAYNEDNKKNTYNFNYSEWSGINIGDVLDVKISLFGGTEIIDKNRKIVSE